MNEDKNIIRRQILAKRSALSLVELNVAAEIALKKLVELPEYKVAKTVMLYMDFRNEVPTGKLIDHVLASGKKLVLPLTDKEFAIIPYAVTPKDGSIKNSLITSNFGISEPNPDKCPVINLQDIDLVIIPGAVFDKYNNRIGYGKGCYDRFLPTLRSDAHKIALAFDFQVLDSIPAESTDIKMDSILIIQPLT